MHLNVLRCTFDQSFNTQQPLTSARTPWPHSSKLPKIKNIGVTGFETISFSFLTVSETPISLHAMYSGRFGKYYTFQKCRRSIAMK